MNHFWWIIAQTLKNIFVEWVWSVYLIFSVRNEWGKNEADTFHFLNLVSFRGRLLTKRLLQNMVSNNLTNVSHEYNIEIAGRNKSISIVFMDGKKFINLIRN